MTVSPSGCCTSLVVILVLALQLAGAGTVQGQTQEPTLAPSGNANGGKTYVHRMTDADWTNLKIAIGQIINTGHGAVVVRNSFHDAGTYNTANPNIGGPHASMRFVRVSNMLENRGLQLAHSLLEPIKQQFGDKISYADLWHFAAAVVVSNSGGPVIPFRPGRADATVDMLPPEGLLPNPEPQSTAPLKAIFRRMGFPDEAIVTLSGAHVLGACHLQNSGYSGQWVRDNARFSNQFFKNLINLFYGINPLRMPNFQGLPRSQWNATTQIPDPQLSAKNLIMLNSDFSLFFFDNTLAQTVQTYATSQAKFYTDFTKYFVQMQELGMTGLLANQVIDVIIPNFSQTSVKAVANAANTLPADGIPLNTEAERTSTITTGMIAGIVAASIVFIVLIAVSVLIAYRVRARALQHSTVKAIHSSALPSGCPFRGVISGSCARHDSMELPCPHDLPPASTTV